MPNVDNTAFESIRALSAVGIALSAEKDERCLLELIVQSAKQLTNADGGTFYSRTDDDELKDGRCCLFRIGSAKCWTSPIG